MNSWYINIILVSACVIVFFIFKFKLEEFMNNEIQSILIDGIEQKLLTDDNKVCNIITDNKDIIGKNDIIDNYRLLSFPNKTTTTCYLKMNDSLVENKCSKLNPNLYDEDKHKDVVKSIEKTLLSEYYQSKLIDSEVCTIEFTDHSQNRVDYVNYLSDKDPKVNNIKSQLNVAKNNNDTLQNNIQDLTQRERSILNEAIPTIAGQIGDTNLAIDKNKEADRTEDEKVRNHENTLQFWKTRPHILQQGKSLYPGQCLYGVSGHRFCFERDGNIAWYNSKNQGMWTNTRSGAPKELKLQDDGNLVAYDVHGKAFWHTNTSRNKFKWFFGLQQHSPPYNLIVQGDGNVVLYDGKKKAIWNSRTDGK